ncbi:MAG: SUMF1/EgtB/PvdO family nonheme iron enzyme, partial [Candidatus Omnitrophota bacterium]
MNVFPAVRKKTPFLFFALLLLAGGCGGSTGNEKNAAKIEIQSITTKTGVEMLLIPAGEFVMGGDSGETDEKPAHKVIISAFFMDKTEVTQKSYASLMGKNPAKSKGEDKPVEQLSWFAAIKYCNMRSMREGLDPCYQLEPLLCNFDANGYRLPTEAEWEYACRAGTSGSYAFGSDAAKLSKYAWHKDNSNKTTHPVGTKAPNPWGLLDMYGNVWEWCNDYYAEGYAADAAQDPKGPASGEKCVLRGGGWDSSAESCRSAARRGEAAGLADVCFGYDAYGFRCVKKADNAAS